MRLSDILTVGFMGKGLLDLHGFLSRLLLKSKYMPTKTELLGFSPQANYTDRAKLVPTFADREGVACSAQRIR
jgi:hypothetical protein